MEFKIVSDSKVLSYGLFLKWIFFLIVNTFFYVVSKFNLAFIYKLEIEYID